VSAAADPSRIDALWEELAPHVEWPERFSLVFLFAGHPRPVGELRSKLEESVRLRGKALKVLDPEDAKAVEGLTPHVIVAPGADCGALWISLLRQAGTPEWTVAIRELLQRLNERRFLLERDVRVPVVMVLPLELRADVYVLAPDLWTVRSYAEQVPAPKAIRRSPTPPRPMAWAPEAGSSPGRVEAEWARLWSTGKRARLAVVDGLEACESAIDRGDLAAARRVARETVAVALPRRAVQIEDIDDFDIAQTVDQVGPVTPRQKHELAAALDVLGEVELRSGDIGAACAWFRRVLELCRARAMEEPGDGRAARDVMISLQNLALVEHWSDNATAAIELLHEAIEIAKARVDANPRDNDALNEWVGALLILGDVELGIDELSNARDAFELAIERCEAWGISHPDDPRREPALAHAWVRLGLVAERSGELGAASRSLYRALTLRERLAAAGLCKGSDVTEVHRHLKDVLAHTEPGLADLHLEYAMGSVYPETLTRRDVVFATTRRLSRPL
jgi:tetratricopeptide (TPR) repeat protein